MTSSSRSINTQWLNSFVALSLTFLVPLVCLCVAFRLNGIYPFGDKSVLIWDLELQHKDYYSYIWEVLRNNVSYDYSFSKSLGGRMIGIIAFYVSSLSNLFLVFFEKPNIVHYLSYLTLVKISLCGLTCGIFLRKSYRFSEWYVLFLSLSYALMAYNVCYCRNPMWLDGSILLPIVCLGVNRLIESRTGYLFALSLALSIVCNWYTGYMLCLMSFFYFIYYIAFRKEWKGSNYGALVSIARKYIFYLLCAVLISSFVLLPACLSLVGGKASFASFRLGQNFGLLTALKGLAILAPYNGRQSPILYGGGLIVVLTIIGLIWNKIPLRSRLGYAYLLAILFGSFCFKPLEIMWTGFVDSGSYFFRFAFISVYILVLISADVVEEIYSENLQPHRVILVVSALLTFVLLDNDRKTFFYSIYVLLFVVLIYFCFNEGKWSKLVLAGILVLLSAELTFNATKVFKSYRVSSTSYASYVREMGAIVDLVKSKEKGPFRFEKTYNFFNISRNGSPVASGESLMFNYMSIENYSSAYDRPVDSFLANLGYSDLPTAAGINNYDQLCETYWRSSMLPADTLLGIKYVLDKTEPYGFNKIDFDLPLPKGFFLYENNSALPLGFNISNNFAPITFELNPFVNQNRIYGSLFGHESLPIYSLLSPVRVPSADKNRENYSIALSKPGPIYVFINGSKLHRNWYKRNCDFFVFNKKIQPICQRFQIHAIYLGNFKAGEKIEFSLNKLNEKGDHEIYLAQLNVEEFYSSINAIKKNNKVRELNFHKKSPVFYS